MTFKDWELLFHGVPFIVSADSAEDLHSLQTAAQQLRAMGSVAVQESASTDGHDLRPAPASADQSALVLCTRERRVEILRGRHLPLPSHPSAKSVDPDYVRDRFREQRLMQRAADSLLTHGSLDVFYDEYDEDPPYEERTIPKWIRVCDTYDQLLQMWEQHRAKLTAAIFKRSAVASNSSLQPG